MEASLRSAWGLGPWEWAPAGGGPQIWIQNAQKTKFKYIIRYIQSAILARNF